MRKGVEAAREGCEGPSQGIQKQGRWARPPIPDFSWGLQAMEGGHDGWSRVASQNPKKAPYSFPWSFLLKASFCSLPFFLVESMSQ